jgi:enamine deaminase RidA (YjgF/YER057c/UK114 family)
MGLADIVPLNYYTTDVDAFLACFEDFHARIAAATGVASAGTLLGVARLTHPDMLVELEATAVA